MRRSAWLLCALAFLAALAFLLGAPLGVGDVLGNLLPVIAGNTVGGSVLVALVYWVIYLRPGAPR